MIDPDDIAAVIADLGEPPYRARQIYEALTRNLVTDFANMSVLPRKLRQELALRLTPLTLDLQTTSVAGDATKVLFITGDGHPIEAVLLETGRRATVCVSTQVGCAVGCSFCASGRDGLTRNLSAAEMVDQVLHFARHLRASARHVTNVVFMGMGEPFHNYDETLRACRWLNDPRGFALASRSISISTAGAIPAIARFAAEPLQINLAVSLHAGTDQLRDRLVPLNRTYPLDPLFAACADYARQTHRKILFEYVVLDGVNDTALERAALIDRLAHRPLYHLNLIAYNETGGEFRRPRPEGVAALAAALQRAGVHCTIRHSPGRGIDAACGQLARRYPSPPEPPASR